MNDKAFIDTNILIYLYSKDESQKQSISLKVIEQFDCIISTQVLNEFCNVCFKKFNKSTDEIELALNEIIQSTTVSIVESDTIKQALTIHNRYGYSFFDCLIIASALYSDCRHLITEDMTDGQVIDNKLTIVNIYSKTNRKYFDS